MKNNFRGWTTVFGFTFRQSTKKAFKVTTALISLLIIGLAIIINIIVAKPETVEEDENKNEAIMMQEFSSINKVFISNQTGLPLIDYTTVDPKSNSESLKNIEFVNVYGQSRSEIVASASKDSDQSLAVIISNEEDAYIIEAIIPYNSTIDSELAENLLSPIKSYFENNKIMQAGLNDEELSAIFTPVISSYSEFGESSNMAANIIKMLAPMIFGMMLYLVILIYGQSVSKSISTEKTSKLMETLLTSIHPYAMITGKVLAVTVTALLQFVTWLLAAITGLYGGNAIAHQIYPSYENSVISFIHFIRDNIGETGLSIPAVLLAVLTFGVGFLFYCVLAALTGSMVSKPEDVASTQGLFQLPVVLSWLVSYFAPLMGKDTLITITRYFPLTSPFCAPADLITGSIGLGEGLLSLLILTAFSLAFIVLAAKTYKGLVLYTGQKASLKQLVNILKAS